MAEASAVKQQAVEIIYVQANEPRRNYYLSAYYPYHKSHYYNKEYKEYNEHYSKRVQQKHQNSYLEKPRPGLSQKAKVNRSGIVFSASR